MPSSNTAKLDALPSFGQRLVWITAFRTVATTLLLVVLSTRLLSAAPDSLTPDDSRSFLLIGLVYLLSIGYAVALRRSITPTWLAYVQITGDLALATLLITRTGGLESPFTFVYLLAVLAGAILLGRRGAIFAALLGSSLLLMRSVLLQVAGRPTWLGLEVEPLPQRAFLLFSNLLGQFLIAWLASYLSDQLLRTGGRLREREADLSALADLQRQILECMPSGLITCRQDGTVTYFNQAAAQILALSRGLERTRIDDVIPGVGSLAAGSRRNELESVTPQGRKVLGLSTTALGETERLIVFQDLTALRRAEDDLRRADHLAALGKLSAQLAHEIRNPLAAMRGAAQLLADDAQPDGQTRRLSGILIRESDRLGALLEDFLRFARPSPPNRRSTAVHELVAQTLEMFRADPLAREVRLEQELPPTWHVLDGDQLRQVLLNLLRNACAAVGPGGAVRVGVAQREGELQVRVWDSAGSIAASDLPRLFEPFFSKRSGGTGLGLSTAHSIVRAHGGTIAVSSDPQKGTEFVIAFPSFSPEAAE